MIIIIINKVVSFINSCNLEISELEFCDDDPQKPCLMVWFEGGEQVFIIIINNFSIKHISYDNNYKFID